MVGRRQSVKPPNLAALSLAARASSVVVLAVVADVAAGVLRVSEPVPPLTGPGWLETLVTTP